METMLRVVGETTWEGVNSLWLEASVVMGDFGTADLVARLDSCSLSYQFMRGFAAAQAVSSNGCHEVIYHRSNGNLRVANMEYRSPILALSTEQLSFCS